jgi:hypothetical protein
VAGNIGEEVIWMLLHAILIDATHCRPVHTARNDQRNSPRNFQFPKLMKQPGGTPVRYSEGENVVEAFKALSPESGYFIQHFIEEPTLILFYQSGSMYDTWCSTQLCRPSINLRVSSQQNTHKA